MEESEQIRTRKAKKALLQALEKSMGIVSHACKRAKVGRTAHYEWIESDPEYKTAVEELDNVAIDFVESKLMTNIQNGSDTAIIFFLKTKGKKRGYVERTEIINTGETTIRIIRNPNI